MFKSGIILATVWSFTVSAVAQGPSPLEVAQAIDQECRQLKNAEEDVRRPAVRKLLARIRQQPTQFEVTLAWNAAVDHADGSDRDTLQEIADSCESPARCA